MSLPHLVSDSNRSTITGRNSGTARTEYFLNHHPSPRKTSVSHSLLNSKISPAGCLLSKRHSVAQACQKATYPGRLQRFQAPGIRRKVRVPYTSLAILAVVSHAGRQIGDRQVQTPLNEGLEAADVGAGVLQEVRDALYGRRVSIPGPIHHVI